MEDLSIILISYNSQKKIENFLKKVPKKIPVIVVENSNNFEMKKKIEKIYSNVKVYIKINNGVSSSINFAVKKLSTKYFLQISPDINLNLDKIKVFYDLASLLNDKFAAIGPRFLHVDEKSHKQISENKDYDSIDSIHGSCMFINKMCFEKIGGFDENIFLYFEETEYCLRGQRLSFKSYQTNKLKVFSSGRSIEFKNTAHEKKIYNLLIWHFIWSKFYFLKKKYNFVLAFMICLPILFRSFIKFFLYKNILKKKNNHLKYKFRILGLINSIKGNKSYLRID